MKGLTLWFCVETSIRCAFSTLFSMTIVLRYCLTCYLPPMFLTAQYVTNSNTIHNNWIRGTPLLCGFVGTFSRHGTLEWSTCSSVFRLIRLEYLLKGTQVFLSLPQKPARTCSSSGVTWVVGSSVYLPSSDPYENTGHLMVSNRCLALFFSIKKIIIFNKKNRLSII